MTAVILQQNWLQENPLLVGASLATPHCACVGAKTNFPKKKMAVKGKLHRLKIARLSVVFFIKAFPK